MSNEDYVPFGPEWKKEMMKWRKEELVELLRDALIYRIDKEDSCPNTTKTE